MDLKQHTYLLLGEAMQTPTREQFVAEWATSSIFDPDPEAKEPDYDAIVRYLWHIWRAAHLTVKEIRQYVGLSQGEFARRFCIPRRSVENWEATGGNARECPRYLIVLLAQTVGLVDIV